MMVGSKSQNRHEEIADPDILIVRTQPRVNEGLKIKNEADSQ